MQAFKRALASVSFAVAGLLFTLIGITNPNSAEADAANMKNRLAFGLKNSPVEVYFVTDWYCPSCKKVEPLIEKLYPKIREKATFYFVDYPIHRKSMNFTPYNLAFLINDKAHYFKARQMLSELTEKTEAPTDEQIEKLASENGLSFKELSYIDVKSGIDFFDQIVEKYKLNSTPTLIFTNDKTHQVIKLEGRDEITTKNVLKALKLIEKS